MVPSRKLAAKWLAFCDGFLAGAMLVSGSLISIHVCRGSVQSSFMCRGYESESSTFNSYRI